MSAQLLTLAQQFHTPSAQSAPEIPDGLFFAREIAGHAACAFLERQEQVALPWLGT